MGEAQKAQIEEIDQINDSNKDIIFNSLSFNFPADHNAYIGNNSRGKEKQEMNIEKGVVWMFRLVDFLFPEQQKVCENQEGDQI